MASADVTVMGGGIFGLSIAWACHRRGARVRLIEAAHIGAGASGGLVGALAPHAPEAWNPLKQAQLDSLLMAEGWWAEVAVAGGGDPGYLRSGRFQPVADDTALALARARAENARTHWGGHAIWELRPAQGAPFTPASPTGWLIFDSLTARISPRMALDSLTAALKAGGAEVMEGTAEAQGEVIHATGWKGLLELSEAFSRRLGQGVKGQALSLRHECRNLPQIQAPGLHIVPHADGTVAVGSTSENSWEHEAPDHQAEDLLARARAVLPELATAEVLETWAGIRPRAKSRSPILGAWPGREGHFIANGGFKIGFGMAPLVAEIMADLVLDAHDRRPDAFRFEALL